MTKNIACTEVSLAWGLIRLKHTSKKPTAVKR